MPPHHNSLSRVLAVVAVVAACFLSSCSDGDPRNRAIISVADQQMLLVRDNKPVKTYRVSTSKFGLGDRRGSNYTPLGHMEVAKKIGRGAPSGAVFKSRRRTGEILRPNAPGRDPIVSRIMWLSGKQRNNRNAYGRFIYIHGTPEEHTIGRPRSYGCIRMKSRDVINLYGHLAVGSRVDVIKGPLVNTPAGQAYFGPPEELQPVAGN